MATESLRGLRSVTHTHTPAFPKAHLRGFTWLCPDSGYREDHRFGGRTRRQQWDGPTLEILS